MSNIVDEKTFNEKVAEFKAVYADDNIALDDKIRLCEEIVYSDFCNKNNRFDCNVYLVDLYRKSNRHQDIIDFITVEFKSRFKADYGNDAETNWWLVVAAMEPSWLLTVADSYISLGDLNSARNTLLALKDNRAEMLKMHPNDGLTHECKFYYSHVLVKLAKIAMEQKNATEAQNYMLDDIWSDYKSVEGYFYTGKLYMGELSSECCDTKLSLHCFSQICDLDVNSDNYDEDDVKLIVEANYLLGRMYAIELGDKAEANKRLNKAKALGYGITDNEIDELIQANTYSKELEELETAYQNGELSSEEKTKSGCYVATCVYGSYDCPQVWTLRRYRDNTLAESVLGRIFIRAYYATSPTIVKLFGDYNWFHKMWRSPLDKLVSKLQKNGVEDTPYDD